MKRKKNKTHHAIVLEEEGDRGAANKEHNLTQKFFAAQFQRGLAKGMSAKRLAVV